MAVHAEASDSAVAATEFRATLAALGIAQNRVARLFGVGQKSIKRWRAGERRVPSGVNIVVRLLACGAVSIDEVERVAVAPPRPGPRGAADRPQAGRRQRARRSWVAIHRPRSGCQQKCQQECPRTPLTGLLTGLLTSQSSRKRRIFALFDGSCFCSSSSR
jgi:hypothetical protein